MFFFFFKQKTAYEWRISDWSSDVCSSDLLERVLIDRPGIVVGKVAAIARDKIPVDLVELAGEGRRVDRRQYRFAIIDAGLHRSDQIASNHTAPWLLDRGTDLRRDDVQNEERTRMKRETQTKQQVGL